MFQGISAFPHSQKLFRHKNFWKNKSSVCWYKECVRQALEGRRQITMVIGEKVREIKANSRAKTLLLCFKGISLVAWFS